MHAIASRRVSIFALLAVLAVGGGLAVASRASAGTATVSAGSGATNVGQTTEIALRATSVGEPGLGAWTVNVSYNPEIVNVTDCDPEGGGVCNPAFGEHTVRANGTNLSGLVGDSTLATLVVRCKTPGSSELTVSLSVFADATIGGPQPIDAAVVNGKVTCLAEGVPTPTPKPTEPSPVTKKGDVNCDDLVNTIDAALILQLTAGLITSLPCQELGDLNHDGQVSSVDAAIVLQLDAGLL
jgi:hypothetical protein